MTIPRIDNLTGDCRVVLKTIPDKSIQCCVTSPPYWGLRDYGCKDQIGLEPTPEAYVDTMREVFGEVWRVLRDDGTMWLNLGDSYGGASGNTRGNGAGGGKERGEQMFGNIIGGKVKEGTRSKDLIGIPWRVAFALQSDGWYLRSDIIWHKPNPMPESVTDRPTKSHEYIFLFTKSERYYYDAEAIATPASDVYVNDSRWESGATETNYKDGYAEAMAQNPKMPHRVFNGERRTSVNRRSVWTVTTKPYSDAHFATFPPDLIEPCILAGTKPGDTVLDPFGGSGTTGMVAFEHGRNAVLIELNPDYSAMAERRCCNVTAPMFP